MESNTYKYYSTQRPIDLSTYPNPTDNPPLGMKFYESRIPVENGLYQAWGELVYAKPLTEQQMQSYELSPSLENEDLRRTMAAQTQTVGTCETAYAISPAHRLTQRTAGHGRYTLKSSVTPQQLAARYEAVQHLSHPPRHKHPRHMER